MSTPVTENKMEDTDTVSKPMDSIPSRTDSDIPMSQSGDNEIEIDISDHTVDTKRIEPIDEIISHHN